MEVIDLIDNIKELAQKQPLKNSQLHGDLLKAIQRLNLAIEAPAETLLRVMLQVSLAQSPCIYTGVSLFKGHNLIFLYTASAKRCPYNGSGDSASRDHSS